jgi:peptidyl-tRNA hydrolase
VLGRFGKSELAVVESALRTAIQAVETWVGEGVEAAMNRYNSAASDSN